MAALERRAEQPGEGPLLDLKAYAPALLTHLANRLGRSAGKVYRRRFGVSLTEWRILAHLALEPGVPASRICQVIGFDKAPVSRSLAALEARRLVTISRDPADARRHAIALTAAGHAVHDRLAVVALERERRFLAVLAPSERTLLIDLLNRLQDSLDASDGVSADG